MERQKERRKNEEKDCVNYLDGSGVTGGTRRCLPGGSAVTNGGT
jgi:hypothetical protein